ncbi:MAG: enhanced serine sensitivity protein SseB C-terminal domain-containing protein [Alphaproteobacteria bacterium]|nr:enhanced serine sensitivity protein SseB C-terminal domain-containing protein [Alphaproteobacteria bacterium]
MSLFIPENPLEEALVKAAKYPALAQDFSRLLLDSNLLVMGTVTAQGDTGGVITAGAGSEFNLVTGEKDGARFLPVFTALSRMQAYAQKECKYLAMKGRALLELTRGAPVTINPGSEYGSELSAAEVARLLDPNVPRNVPLSAYPELDLPLPLANALSDLFDKRGDVTMAWMIRITPEGAPMPLVGIQTTADMAALMADIEAVAQQKLPGLVFDVQQVDPARPVAMAEALMAAKPFYPRTSRILN